MLASISRIYFQIGNSFVNLSVQLKPRKTLAIVTCFLHCFVEKITAFPLQIAGIIEKNCVLKMSVTRKVSSPVIPTLHTYLSSLVCAVQLKLLLCASLSV